MAYSVVPDFVGHRLSVSPLRAPPVGSSLARFRDVASATPLNSERR